MYARLIPAADSRRRQGAGAAPSAEPVLRRVREIHTLGPAGTNCERAAREWLARAGRRGRVVLHPTLEAAAAALPVDGRAGLMGCIAYPDLHTLMFANLGRLRLADCLITATHPMVLAAREARQPRSVVTHPAPRLLVPAGVTEVILTTSNARAADECAAGRADGCITTGAAAEDRGLILLRDFGPIHMGFTIHVPCDPTRPARRLR